MTDVRLIVGPPGTGKTTALDRLGRDPQGLRRLLGLAPYMTSGRHRLATSIKRNIATEICRAANIDPVDVGL